MIKNYVFFFFVIMVVILEQNLSGIQQLFQENATFNKKNRPSFLYHRIQSLFCFLIDL
jgi:hypothetical protein